MTSQEPEFEGDSIDTYRALACDRAHEIARLREENAALLVVIGQRDGALSRTEDEIGMLRVWRTRRAEDLQAIANATERNEELEGEVAHLRVRLTEMEQKLDAATIQRDAHEARATTYDAELREVVMTLEAAGHTNASKNTAEAVRALVEERDAARENGRRIAAMLATNTTRSG